MGVRLRQTRSAHRPRLIASASGVTLVELLVTLAVIAGLVGSGVYLIGMVTHTELRDEAMRLAAAMKYSASQAALNNAQYRMVFDLDARQYHTEVTQSPVVVEAPVSRQAEGLLPEEAQELARTHEAKRDIFDKRESDPFGVNRKVTYEQVEDGIVAPHAFENGIRIARMITPQFEQPVTSGKAAVSFFRNGMQQQAMIVLQDERGAAYTLITEPLTGRVRVLSDAQEVPRDFGEVEDDD